MESNLHQLPDLFLQLGLPQSDTDIDNFIAAHRPLPRTVQLSDAPFWTKAQRQLLKQAVLDDADWAIVVDELDTRLR